MTRQMSIREFRAALARIEQELSESGEIVLTRNGRPVARISGVLSEQLPRYRENSAFRRTISKPKRPISEILEEARGRY